MATYDTNIIKEQVWKQIVKREGIPPKSRAALDIEENTDEAIDAAIVLTAQAIFEAIIKKQTILPVKYSENTVTWTAVPLSDIMAIENKWLHDACDFCKRRQASVIKRHKDGKRIGARCEASQPYTESEIH